MGYYINTDSGTNKASFLEKNHGAKRIQKPAKFQEGLICVVDNGMFEAAAYVYSDREFDAFKNHSRPTTWLVMDDATARTLFRFDSRHLSCGNGDG